MNSIARIVFAATAIFLSACSHLPAGKNTPSPVPSAAKVRSNLKAARDILVTSKIEAAALSRFKASSPEQSKAISSIISKEAQAMQALFAAETGLTDFEKQVSALSSDNAAKTDKLNKAEERIQVVEKKAVKAQKMNNFVLRFLAVISALVVLYKFWRLLAAAPGIWGIIAPIAAFIGVSAAAYGFWYLVLSYAATLPVINWF